MSPSKRRPAARAWACRRRSPGTTYIKGNKMRTDIRDGRQDPDDDLRPRRAEDVHRSTRRRRKPTCGTWRRSAARSSPTSTPPSMKASVKPNGQTKEIAGTDARPATTWRSSVPAAHGRQQGHDDDVTLAGPVWIVKDAPGTADYTSFYKAAVEKGWIFSDPRAAKASAGPGQGDGRDVPAVRRDRRHRLRDATSRSRWAAAAARWRA